MRVLGIDPGFSSLGWAVVNVDTVNRQASPVRVGIVKTEKANKKIQLRSSEDNIKRAQEIYRELEKVIKGYDIELIATESMSWPRNAGVVAKMGIAWGVLASICEVENIPMIQSSPVEIKRKACGDGKASKERMIQVVQVLSPNLEWPSQVVLHEHCADAVGAVIAILDSEIFKWANTKKS